MARTGEHPLVMFLGLGVFVVAASIMVFFGARMALFRAVERDVAQPMLATVLNVDQRVSSDSDGKSTTYYSFMVELDLGGRIVERQLVAANFEPDDIWFNSDQIDLSLFRKDGRVDVLIRPDLDYRATPADWVSAYMTSIVLIAFGSFILAFLTVWCRFFFR